MAKATKLVKTKKTVTKKAKPAAGKLVRAPKKIAKK